MAQDEKGKREAHGKVSRAREKARELRIAFEGEATIRGAGPTKRFTGVVHEARPDPEPAVAAEPRWAPRVREVLLVVGGLLALGTLAAVVMAFVDIGYHPEDEMTWTVDDALRNLFTALAISGPLVLGLRLVQLRRAGGRPMLVAAGVLTVGLYIANESGTNRLFSAVWVALLAGALLAMLAAGTSIAHASWLARAGAKTPSSPVPSSATEPPEVVMRRYAGYCAWVLPVCIAWTLLGLSYWIGSWFGSGRWDAQRMLPLIGLLLLGLGASTWALLVQGARPRLAQRWAAAGAVSGGIAAVAVVAGLAPAEAWAFVTLVPSVALLLLQGASAYVARAQPASA